MTRIKLSGSNIVISNGVVTVNGKRIDLDENEKHFTLEIAGDVTNLDVDVCETITITGSAKSVKTTNGDVKCGDIAGNVSTTNGDVTAQKINGSVSTVNGDISKW